MVQIEGTVKRITFKAEDTGYVVIHFDSDDFESFVCVGVMPDADKGLTVKLDGDWCEHPKFGKQFKFNSYAVPQPDTEDGVIAYLSTLKCVKASLAAAIYRHFGEEVFEVLESTPERLIEVRGIGKKNLAKIVDNYQQTKGLRQLIAFLHTVGISAGYAPKIYKEYRENAIAAIKENPYLLAGTVRGFGFKRADELARSLGIAADSFVRAEAAILHVMNGIASLQGHCFAKKDWLLTEVASTLALPDYRPQIEDIENGIKQMKAASRKSHQRLVEKDDAVYIHRVYEQEKTLAKRIADAAGVIKPRIDVDEWLEQYDAKSQFKLAVGQKNAVVTAVCNGISVMTGGAGAGKMQPYSEPVLTPDGWKQMGDIKPGSLVISKNGTPTKVLEVFPGKDLEIYRVCFDDGTWTECCIDHLWAVQSPKQRDRQKGNYSVLPLRDMLEKISNPKIDSRKTVDGGDRIKQHYYSVDYCEPVEFSKKQLVLHPYLLGWLLGDGYLPERKAPCISTWIEDSEEIALRLDQYLPEDVKSSLHRPSKSGLSVRKYCLNMAMNKYLKELGLLGCKSQEKFIPDQYMMSDITDRKFLLSGLLDTDGSGANGKIRFSSFSKHLAEQVVELTRSLGGRATLSVNRREDRGVEYHVFIRTPFNPFILNRKQAVCDTRKLFQKFRKRIVSAEYVGKKDGQCILIDHPSHLYITRDYTVTHNTMVSKAIIEFWAAERKKIMAVAPTGKAAQRIREATGLRSASTIHRLLGWTGTGFAHNAEYPLECDAILIDEASMMDLSLAYALFQAIPRHASILLVGDVNQLPSVGSGSVLRDIINSNEIPVARLTEVFRQGESSRIIGASHQINDGQFPSLETIGRSTGNSTQTDALWLKCDQNKITDAIKWLVAEKLSEFGWQQDDIQLLSPQHRGDVGNIALNQMVQATWNPSAKGKPEVRGFRVGDRVIQTRNDYDKGVFNGDIGKIEAIDLEERILTLRFPDIDRVDGKSVEYKESDLDDVMLAYSISIHKSQGSEFPVVVIPCTMQHFMMLQRNLLYTGITRAKKLLVLVGEERAINQAVRTQKIDERNTMLAQRIQSRSVVHA